MKKYIVIQGPVATRSGYGDHTRDLVHSLIAMDKYDIEIISLPWGACPMDALNIQDDKDKLIIERLIPGAITPPSYTPFLIISNVVAVPKSIINEFLNSFEPIALTILSDPRFLKFLTLILIIFFIFKSLIS